MAFVAAADLLDALRRHRLLTAEQAAELTPAVLASLPTPHALAKSLLDRGWLSAFQINQLFQGKGQELTFGSYILLEKLGEGGMGTVYKARNWKLNKVVALKVIRKERLATPDVLRRFEREIRSASQLNHPHIVRAFDADQINGSHFFVMEFVEGVNLSELVKKQGPLPVAQASAYVRQAALGLQHAHERGLVHRDIKPHNLLVCRSRDREGAGTGEPLPHGRGSDAGIIKILDMGLARLDLADPEADGASTMTQEGQVMGTPDYIAPEQIIDSHHVDIRADLYSLGCTLYFLLAGKAPFAGLSLGQKLIKHQQEEPPPLQTLRPETPPEVATLVRTLMAKRPEDRFQTPADLAAALDLVLRGDHNSPTLGAHQEASKIAETFQVLSKDQADPFSATLPLLANLRQDEERRQRRNQWWLVGGVGVAGTCALLLLILKVIVPLVGGDKPAAPPVVVGPKDKEKNKVPDVPPAPNKKTPPDNPAFVAGPVDDAWLAAVAKLDPAEQAKAVYHKLAALNPGFDVKYDLNRFEVKDDQVVEFHLHHPVTDLSPLRALKKLGHLVACANRHGTPPTILVSATDISPLQDLPLYRLDLKSFRVDDLKPLAKMKLIALVLENTLVSDLEPLRNMQSLRELSLVNTPVAHLEPLEGLPLQALYLSNTQVKDFSALKGMPLVRLRVAGLDLKDLAALPMGELRELDICCCPVADLSPLAGAKHLSTLVMAGVPDRDLKSLRLLPIKHLVMHYDPALAPTLRDMFALETLNDIKLEKFWKLAGDDPEHQRWHKDSALLAPEELAKAVRQRFHALNPRHKGEPLLRVEQGQIVEAAIPQGSLTDLRFLTPLKDLRALKIQGAAEEIVVSFEPLRGLPLRRLEVNQCRVFDLSPLQGMPLEHLSLGLHLVRDVSPLKNTKLKFLQFGSHGAAVPQGGFAALRDLPLEELTVQTMQRRDGPTLAHLKRLQQLNLYYSPGHHDSVLRSLSVEKINSRPPHEFWANIAKENVTLVERELKRLNPGFAAKLTPEIKANGDIWLNVFDDNLQNISPLRLLPELKLLGLASKTYPTAIALTDLSPLKHLRLTHLSMYRCTQLTDLQPLRDLPLVSLTVHESSVQDVAPIAALPLQELVLSRSQVRDLTPLRGTKIATLDLDRSLVRDYSPIAGLPLGQLALDFDYYRDAGWLRAHKTLKKINNMETAAFWKSVDERQAEFEKWCAEVALLPAKDQVQAVLDRLKKHNPAFVPESFRAPEFDQGQVVLFDIQSLHLTDLTPVRALKNLRTLVVVGDSNGAGKLVNLWPVRDLKLDNLVISGNKDVDLAGIQGMKFRDFALQYCWLKDLKDLDGIEFEKLGLQATQVADLTPLKKRRLTSLHLRLTQVKDLEPLRGMPLTNLWAPAGVTNLEPLRGMPLESLNLSETANLDLSVLTSLPRLQTLTCKLQLERDAPILRQIPTLKTINGMDKDQVLK